jgi:hypothetical protein
MEKKSSIIKPFGGVNVSLNEEFKYCEDFG